MDAQRKSFFRRSSSARSLKYDGGTQVRELSARRLASTAGSAGGLVAGPAYVATRQGDRNGKDESSLPVPQTQDDSDLTPIATSLRQVSLSETHSSTTSPPAASPSRLHTRGPIHPALASPPTSRHHLAGREGPYPAGRRDNLPPKGAQTDDSQRHTSLSGGAPEKQAVFRRDSRHSRPHEQQQEHGIAASARPGSDTVPRDRPTLTVQTVQTARRPVPASLHAVDPQVHLMLGFPTTPPKPPSAFHTVATGGPSRSPRSSAPDGGQSQNRFDSEASAYAKEVTSRLQKQHRVAQSDAALPNNRRRSSRPLPQPPRSLSASVTVGSLPASAVSSPDSESVSRIAPAPASRSRNGIAGAAPPAHMRNEQSSQAGVGTPQSSDSHQYHERRLLSEQQPIDTPTIQQAAPQARSNAVVQLTPPPDLGHRPASLSNVAPPPTTAPRDQQGAHQNPRLDRKSNPLAYLLSYPAIQAVLLSHLNINTFLALTGSSELLRKQFTGEAIGKWVLSEWSMRLDKERGRSWPNLTVWEGFLESMLHDAATYSTYSPHWHNLLRHLSLSHTLIVLHLRTFPNVAFPNPAPLPFEEDMVLPASPLHISPSSVSLSGMTPSTYSRSRRGSLAGSEVASIAGSRPPRAESLMEIVMPEPLAPSTSVDANLGRHNQGNEKVRRKSSINSLASASSLPFGRRRSNSASVADARPASVMSVSSSTIALPAGKAALPPVSFPAAKRYGFKRHVDAGSARSRTSSDSGRPFSVFSNGSSPSIANQSRLSTSFHHPRNAPPLPELHVSLGSGIPRRDFRGSIASSDPGRSGRRIDHGSVMRSSRLEPSSQFSNRVIDARIEPAFDRPIPFVPGRAPLLRVFVPLSNHVRRWPSAEGAAAAMRELDKCGASRRLRLGDLIVNTAIAQPRSTEHILLFVPSNKHLLIPLEYTFNPGGHLPASVDAFALPPSYYHSFFAGPQVVFLNLAPFASQAYHSIRLAFDRRDVITASGARVSAKRYLYVAGFQIESAAPVSSSWAGMISLETEGTAEGRKELESRLGDGDSRRVASGPWEVVAEKSLQGSIWLRLLRNR